MRDKKRRTTRHDPRAAPTPDLLRRDFVTNPPNRVWLAKLDITYIPTQEGFLYLAFILDTHSIRIVGWSMDSHKTELVVDALEIAVAKLGGESHPRDSCTTLIAAPSTRLSLGEAWQAPQRG